MSWSYSPGLVVAFSEASCSGTEPSALSSLTPMPDQFYWPDKPTEHSRISRFGMTCEPLTVINGGELLTWFLEGFRVRTSAWQEAGPDWTAKGLGYGEKWLGLLAKYDHDSRSLKTVQCSFLEDLTGCSLTLPRSGLMCGGECYQLPMLVPPISASASGYWPTPCATDDSDRKPSAQMHETRNGTFKHRAANGTLSQVRLSQVVRHKAEFPTATATAAKGSSSATLSRKDGKSREFDRLDHYAQANPGGATGQLNPDWVEWLMGWPTGHSALKPLATGKYQEFVQQHGECSEASE